MFASEQFLPKLTASLRKRYPSLAGCEAAMMGDTLVIRLRGALELLQSLGLVTDAMLLRVRDGRRGSRHTPIGDGFCLFFRPEGGADQVELQIFTGPVPHDCDRRIGLRDARRQIERIRRECASRAGG